jgi:DNA N-6-adenine-methyltransferase (Dam)
VTGGGVPVQMPLLSVEQGALTSDDYYTPPRVFDALGLRFDLDVAMPSGGLPWVPADRYYTLSDDGLAAPWEGRVWMNPPFSNTGAWVRRFIEHGHGIALLPHAKSFWHPVMWAAAEAVVVPDEARLADRFVGGRPAMSVWFAAFGPECVDAIGRLGAVRVVRGG